MTVIYDLFATPPTFIMPTRAKFSLGFDLTAQIASLGGGTPSAPTAELIDLETDEPVTIASPTLTGDVVTVVVVGSALTPLHPYRLDITYVLNANTVPCVPILINVPF